MHNDGPALPHQVPGDALSGCLEAPIGSNSVGAMVRTVLFMDFMGAVTELA
jgi:hypothetical protein